ncbi:hypothetical protein GCM10009809_34030 [Isoptericola hypogeus]|uniref:Sulfatase N-terminal domain-containing protein n=1 Tax=Isoptericola hypogeus TaxID=300179 RepID=A0ABP4VXD8_9MICO
MTATVTRRSVLGAGAAGLATTLAAPSASASTPRSRTPNFVVVYVDDLGYGDLGCYGSPLVRTPVLDGMARRGMRFTDFYSGSPVCTPSRAALMTGCYGPRVNLPAVLFPYPRDVDEGISAEETTIAEYLKREGYATGIFGKWHLGDPASRAEHHPMEHGFDRYFGIPYSNDMDPVPLYDDREIVEEPVDQATITRRLSEQAVAFVREHADEPFFVYLAHHQPHEPLASEFAGRSAAGAHGDSVEEIDHYVGVLLDELDALGIREDTCVVFTSDNGPWYVGSAGDLYGRKAETYEGGMRVPFLVEWPGVVPRGATYREPGQLVDLLPTILAAVGARPDPGRVIDGHDLLTAWRTGRRVDRGDIFYYEGGNGRLNAVRRGDWKLHVSRAAGPYFTGRGFSSTAETPQLFNLRTDPEESYDLSEHRPELVEELADTIRAFDAALRADRAARYGS